jgi:hypothetical protein
MRSMLGSFCLDTHFIANLSQHLHPLASTKVRNLFFGDVSFGLYDTSPINRLGIEGNKVARISTLRLPSGCVSGFPEVLFHSVPLYPKGAVLCFDHQHPKRI